MQTSKLSTRRVKEILARMIHDSSFCSRVATVMDKKGGQRFDSDWANVVAKLCCEHLRIYSSAPGNQVTLHFDRWAQSTNANPKVVSQIEEFLEDCLSSNTVVHEGNGSLLDHTKEYFELGKAKDILTQAEDCIDRGDVEGAYKLFQSATRVELQNSNVYHPLEDHETWLEVFTDEGVRPLFEYPGDLGKLVGPSFTRGSLYAFMGVDKAGKSWYLIDAAFRLLKNRHRVAYFEVGDLGRNEVFERLGQRILREPVGVKDVEWPISWDKKDPDIPICEERHKEGVSVGHALKHARKYTRSRHLLKLACYPNSSVTVAEIAALIQEWKRESNWKPDAIIIDYADILAPPRGMIDSKDQIDETWKQLRRLSQIEDCLVLTATQTGAQAYRKRSSILTRGDFSGRKTKLAHVNGMLGLNMTAQDKMNDMTRVNWVVRRKGGGSELTQVLVAGCFAAGMPIVLSKFASYAKQQLTADDSEEQDSSDNSEWED